MVSEDHAKLLRKYFKHIPDKKKRYQYFSSRDRKLLFSEYHAIPRNDFIKIINNDFEEHGLKKLPAKVILSNIRTYDQVIADTRAKRIKREEAAAAEKRQMEEKVAAEKKHEAEKKNKKTPNFTDDDKHARRKAATLVREIPKTNKYLYRNAMDVPGHFSKNFTTSGYAVNFKRVGDEKIPDVKLYEKHLVKANGRSKYQEIPVNESELKDEYIKKEFARTKKELDYLRDKYDANEPIPELYAKYANGKYSKAQKDKISKTDREKLRKVGLGFIKSDNGFYYLGFKGHKSK